MQTVDPNPLHACARPETSCHESAGNARPPRSDSGFSAEDAELAVLSDIHYSLLAHTHPGDASGMLPPLASLDERLDRDVPAIRDDLFSHYMPVGPLECELVRQLTDEIHWLRQLTAGRRGAFATGLATYQSLMPLLVAAPTDTATDSMDAAAAWAVTRPPFKDADRCVHAKLRAILKHGESLQKVQALRRVHGAATNEAITATAVAVPSGPSDNAAGHWLACDTEATAERLFRAWRQRAGLPCPECESTRSPLELRTRPALQCRSCGAQTGLRTGTVIAKSKITFLVFVKLVRLLSDAPTTPIQALCRLAGVRVRSLRPWRERLLDALADPARRPAVQDACGWRQVWPAVPLPTPVPAAPAMPLVHATTAPRIDEPPVDCVDWTQPPV